MNILMASYHAVSILGGGPRVQILRTADHLEGLGIRVGFFDSWNPPGKVDLVHLFAANIGTYHLARELFRSGVPYVVSPILFSSHSPGFVRRAFAGARVLQRVVPGFWSDYAICAEICSRARAVLPNTSAEAELLRNGLGVPAGKIHVVPNGVEERFVSADPSLFRAETGLQSCILTVGHVGPPRKNVLRLLRAVAGVDAPVVVLGRLAGDEADACVREARGNPRVKLLGPVDHDAPLLASAYAACDVFVLPSIFETPGIAALEAGLAGARIVITPHGGTREYFRDHAVYVDPRSEESIREGIVKALGQPRTPALRDHIREHFLWERVAERTAEVYRAVLKGS